MSLQATARRNWRPTVVVPREACVFESLSCAGVAWHERRGFARLQALRLAPYVTTGASAAVRRGQLMLWLWDKAEVDAAITAQGLEPELTRTIAETLLLEVPMHSGPCNLPCQGGTDHIDLANGAIRASHWTPARAGQRPASETLLARPWASDLLAARWWSQGGEGLSPQRLATTASLTVAVASAAYLGFWAGSLASLQQQAEVRRAQPEQQSVDLAALERLKRSEREDLAWMQHYRRLSTSLQVRPLLDALEKPLEANRLVIKELEVRNDDLRLSLASVGGEIDLPGVLVALQGVPGIDTVQLRQNADTVQATYTMRSTGFREPVLLPARER